MADEITAVENALSALKEADAIQEKALTDLPPATAALYLDKGRAYLLLKQLSRTARRLLSDQPAAADEFSLSILRRRGSRKSDTAASEGAEAIATASL